MPPKEPDLVGTTLGQFRIVEKIGEGGMGVVYKAIDERLRRTVALKVLPLAAGGDRERQRRFLREARAAASVGHANIATIYEADEADGRVFIAMELVEGESLRAVIQNGRLSPPDALRVGKGIARALVKAHERGIVHRDLKPDNVMISVDGDVKVLDFGLAKALGPPELTKSVLEREETVSRGTEQGRLLGTPAYMSPEQATGKDVDARTDVFSFGVVLYEMLTGVRPFRGESVMDVVVSISRDTPAPPSQHLPEIAPAFEKVILRCLEKKQVDRYRSARHLLRALDAIDGHKTSDVSFPTPSGGLPTLDTVTKDPSHPVAASRRVGRPLVVGGAGVAAALVLVAGVLVLRKSATAPEAARVDAAAQIESSVPAAATAFATAMKAEATGDREASCTGYERAADLDPTFSRAALRSSVCLTEDVERGRKYFRQAWAHRDSLSERDAMLLDAFEPWYQRTPADLAEEGRRLRAMVARFPDDAEAHALLASDLALSEGSGPCIAEFDKALALNPRMPHVLEIKADHLAYDGNFAGALAAVDDCLRIAPDSQGCLEERIWIEGDRAECDRVIADAQRALLTSPTSTSMLGYLASALYVQNGELGAVREIDRRKEAALEGDERADAESLDRVNVAISTGAFLDAEAALLDLQKRVADRPRAIDHVRPATLLVGLEREMGKDAWAKGAARGFLDAHDAWAPNARGDDWSMAEDPTPWMMATLAHVGAMPAAELEAGRDAWVARWRARAEPIARNFIWLLGYAQPTETADEAKAAIGALPAYQPLPPFKPLQLLDADLGRTLFLAGRIDASVPVLERAAHSCFALEHILEATRANLFLGLAREAKGDVPGACAAYAAVQTRWGTAKPRSVTWEKASARMRALGCPGEK